jgi:hypothetical protein
MEADNMNRIYANLEENTRLNQLVESLELRQTITLWKLENYSDTVSDGNTSETRIDGINYVWQLLDKENADYMENYVVDYIRFNMPGVTVVIKPNRWR